MGTLELNAMQREAVLHREGPLLIIAGAGSGKTRAMTGRIAALIQGGVSAYNILARTFTNKAAKEMARRVEELTGGSAGDAWIGTFHSVCVRILRRDIDKLGYSRSFVIYDDEDQARVLKDLFKRYSVDEKQLSIREMQRAIGDAKTKLMDAGEWFSQTRRDRKSQTMYEIFEAYDTQLRKANALDFDDLLMKALTLLADHPPVLEHYRDRFQYVHVDEYQDTNLAQYSLVKLLTQESRNLCVVGDDDQSIYGWRGADIRNILDFQRDFPEARVIKLEQNYRSTQTILDAANALIKNNEQRMGKELWTDGKKGDTIRFAAAGDEREEAAWICEHVRRLRNRRIPLADIAVLYRMHAQSRVLEEMFMRAGIPYRVYGGTRFYDRREIKDALAYLRLLVNPADDVALKRVINVPKRAIGDATVDVLEEHAQESGEPLFSSLRSLPDRLASRPRKCVESFVELMDMLARNKDLMGLSDFVKLVLDESGLIKQYEGSADEEELQKRDNLLEFLGAVGEFERHAEDASLEGYLENVALVTDLDMQEESPQHVTLMTLHSAKGLEYRAVFIAGLEDGLLPSSRATLEENRLEEERRLFYVGITRAKEYLYLTRTRHRSIFNQATFNQPSPFLSEIPKELISDEYGNEMREHFGEYKPPKERARPSQRAPKTGFGTPGMGQDAFTIPGVQRGFAPSVSADIQAPPTIFAKGDRVLHRKFGSGEVVDARGAGADARVVIHFTAYGEKEFSVAIAPIVKVE
ncbi:MAG TPA: UvrD-helicase domain-containing protein [Candidatus Limnocylindria bacterium]|nr:UvrD-helicase domain-containing protein [Candidatus Limnocylindria bacterium]